MPTSSLPLYRKIFNDLQAKIEGGVYSLGTKLPSEPELEELYGVSRITVRRAVSELVDEGFLVKEQGRGTFVRSQSLRRSLRSSFTQSFTDACHEAGLTAGARVVDVSIVPAPTHYAELLGLESHELLIHVRRTRTADDWPIFDENTYLPYEGYNKLLEIDLTDASMFDVTEKLGGVRPLYARKNTIDAVPATAEQARELGVVNGSPLLKLSMLYVGNHEEPVSLGRSFFVGGRYTFEM